jgi:sugar phosphate permease
MTHRLFYGWWTVLSCFIIALYVGGINFCGFTAFIEPLVEDFGWSYTQISFAASLRGLEMGFLAPFIGFLADRFGSRKLILIGIITVGLGMILLANTHSLGMFYAAILLLSLGAGGCTSVVTMTAIANWFDRDVGKAFGVASSGFGASGLMVPLMVRLIDTYTWRIASIIFAIGTWLLGIPLSLIIRDTPEQYGYLPDGKPPGDGGPMTENRDEVPGIGFIQVLKKKSYLCVLSAESLRMLALTAVSVHVMPYLGHLGWSRTSAGLVAAGIPISGGCFAGLRVSPSF